MDYNQQLKDLVRRRPELKHSMGSLDSRAHKFVTRQQYWVNKGYTEKKAFDKTEEEMAENLQEVKTHAGMQLAIGSSGSIKSFYDHYQAVAEYEGRLKVKRLEKDLSKYKRVLSGISVFDNNQYINDWENLNATVENNYNEEVGADDFSVKARKLVKIHHEKVNKYDGLSGLSENPVLFSAQDAYNALKSANTKLAEDLTKLGVKFDNPSTPDLSQIKDAALRESLKNNKLISLIFQNTFDTPPVPLEPIKETKGPDAVPGELLAPPLKYDSENPYKQIYGRLPKSQYESQEDRIERLKRIWNTNQLKSRDATEQISIQQKAVEALRNVRIKVDQILVSNNKEAVFPPNREISKKDLLLTHKFDIEKINIFLNTDLSRLVDNERERMELYEIENMVTEKEVVEDVEPGRIYDGMRSDLNVIKDEEDEYDYEFIDEEKEERDETEDEEELGLGEGNENKETEEGKKYGNTLATKRREVLDLESIGFNTINEIEYEAGFDDDQGYDINFSSGKYPADANSKASDDE